MSRSFMVHDTGTKHQPVDARYYGVASKDTVHVSEGWTMQVNLDRKLVCSSLRRLWVSLRNYSYLTLC